MKVTAKQLSLHNRISGVSLIELLIAMTLGLILLAGMIAVFSGNKRSSELNTAMANIQENARFALSALGKDIRMAGFQGCLDSRRGRMIVKSVDAPVPTDGVNADGSVKHNINLSAATESSCAWHTCTVGSIWQQSSVTFARRSKQRFNSRFKGPCSYCRQPGTGKGRSCFDRKLRKR